MPYGMKGQMGGYTSRGKSNFHTTTSPGSKSVQGHPEADFKAAGGNVKTTRLPMGGDAKGHKRGKRMSY